MSKEIKTKKRRGRKPSKNNYFNNRMVQKEIVLYQTIRRQIYLFNFLYTIRFINGTHKESNYNKMMELKRFSEKLFLKIMSSIEGIIKAIINTYAFYRYDQYDDLKQEAWMACLPNVEKFNASKGTAFNFFSLISKKSLLALTYKQQKHRENVELNGIYVSSLTSEEIFEKVPLNIDNFCDTIEDYAEFFMIDNDKIKDDEDYEYVLDVLYLFTDYLRKNKNLLLKDFREELKANNIKYKYFLILKKIIKENISLINFEEASDVLQD